MKKLKRLLVNILPIVAFGIAPILNLVTLPLVTASINPNLYGVYSYYISLINIILLLCLFPSLNSVILRYLNKNFEYYKQDRIVVRNLVYIGSILFFAISALFYIFYQDSLFLYLICVYYLIFLMNFYKSFLNTNGEKVKFSLILLTTSLFQYTFLFLLYFLGELNVYSLLLGNFIFSLLFLCYLLIKRKNVIFKREDMKYDNNFKKILRFAIPSLFIALAGIILSSSDRILIKNLLVNGDYYVGIYSVNYTVYAQVIDLLVAVFYLFIPAFLYKKYEKEGEDSYLKNLEKVFNRYLLLSTIITVVIMISYEKINMLLFDESYLLTSKLPQYVLLGQYFFGLYRIISNYFLVKNNQKITSYSLIIIAILNIILNWIFIPKYGFIAAAVSTLFCFLLLFVVIYILFFIKTKMKIINLSNIIYLVLPLLILAVDLPIYKSQNKILVIQDLVLEMIITTSGFILFYFIYSKLINKIKVF